MMQDAREGKFDAIIVHKWDRLNRSRYDAIRYKAILRRDYHLKLFVIEGISEDEDELVGMVYEAMTEVWSELYSRNLSRETQKGKHEKAREGKHNNRAPFGVDKTKDGIILANPRELPGVILAMESYSTGHQSDNSVALILNQAGYATKQGKPFTGEMVREMLQNRIYIGQVRYQRYHQHRNGSRDTSTQVEWFKGQHPVLVPIELFERCQEVRRVLRKRPNRPGHCQVYLLSGLIYCGYCGRRMRAQKSPSGKRYYRCVNYAVGQSCEHRMIPADIAESKVIETILGMAHSSNIGVESTNVHARTRDIEQEITELKETLTRIDLEWEEGFILKDAYLEKRQRLQTELSRLQPFHDTEITETRLFMQKLAANWQAGDSIERKRLLHHILEGVWARERQVTGLKLRPVFAYVTESN